MSSLDLEDEEALRRAYVDEGHSLSAIAEMADCSYASVRRALLAQGIEIRRSGPAPIGRLRDKAWLQTQVREGRSARDIAGLLGCAEGTVRSALQWAGVTTGGPRATPPALEDVSFLERVYVVEGRSVRSIAAEVGSTKDAVLAALRTHGVPVRSRGRNPRPVISPSDAVLDQVETWESPSEPDPVSVAPAGERPPPGLEPGPGERLELHEVRESDPEREDERDEPVPGLDQAPEPSVAPAPEHETAPEPEAATDPEEHDPPEQDEDPGQDDELERKAEVEREPETEEEPEWQLDHDVEHGPEAAIDTEPAPAFLPPFESDPDPDLSRLQEPLEAVLADALASETDVLRTEREREHQREHQAPNSGWPPEPSSFSAAGQPPVHLQVGAPMTQNSDAPAAGTHEPQRSQSGSGSVPTSSVTSPPGRIDVEIDKIETKTFPISRRGYDRDAVDAFLRSVAADYRQVVRSAKEAVNAARAATPPAPPPAAPSSPAQPFEDVGGHVTAVLRSAAEAAGEIKASAEKDALSIRQRAREETEHLRQAAAETLAEAEELRAAIEQEAAEADAAIRAQADSIVLSAQQRAAQLEEEARLRLTTMDRTVRANIDAAIAEARRDYEHLRSAQQQCIDRLASVEFLAKHARDGLSENVGLSIDELL